MKRRIISSCLFFALTALVVALSYGSRAEHFAGEMKGYPKVAIKDVLHSPARFARQNVTICGKMTRQCPTLGCWFMLTDADGAQIRVDVSSTCGGLPGRVGHTATVEGQLIPFGDAYQFVGTGLDIR
jgi:hypothetical protein